MLILGDEIQLAESDQEIYHRYLIEPGLSILRKVQGGQIRALILGGADGYSLQRVVADRRVGSITLVDHDRELVELFATGVLGQLFKTTQAFADKRVQLEYQDAFDYVLTVSDRHTYDFVIFDTTDDWFDGERAGEALRQLTRHNRDRRLLISINAGTDPNAVQIIRRSGIEVIAVWSIPIPSFGDPWWCMLATPGGNPRAQELGVEWLAKHAVKR